MKKKIISTTAILITTLMLPLLALAENDPRDSIAAPGGTNLFLFYYRSYNGNDFYKNDSKLDDNSDFNLQLAIARYAHFVSLGDWTWSYDILQPFGRMDFESDPLGIDLTTNGLGDTNFATHINTPFLIQTDKMKYGMSAGFYLTTPTGEYDSDKAANLGANRWTYKFEVTPVIWQVNHMTLEVSGDVKLYTDNSDYGSGSLTEETDPLFGLQTHLSYDITDSFWVGLSHYFYSGGENEIDGVASDDRTRTQSLRFTSCFKVSPQVILMLQYDSEIEHENGVKQDYIGTRIAYVW